MPKESIVDASVPSAGRIYDYMMGGHHNFEVDRQAAERILQFTPFARKMVRLQRWCLQDIAYELSEVRGYDTIIDFASGLPTQDNLHRVVKKGTTVIYSDYDPVVVEYAREILGETPDVYFFEADARKPEDLLYRAEVQRILGGKRNVAIVYWGIAMFLNDADLAHVARTLHDWTGEGASWAFNAQGAGFQPSSDPSAQAIVAMYETMGSALHFRNEEQYRVLLKPWKPDKQGFVSLLNWHDLDSSELTSEDVAIFGESGAGYGTYLVK